MSPRRRWWGVTHELSDQPRQPHRLIERDQGVGVRDLDDARVGQHRAEPVRVLRAIAAEPDLLERAADALPGFDHPALIVWAAEDRVMPPEHGRRLAGLLPQSRLVEVADSYTLIPLDQPATLARAVRELTRGTASLRRAA